MSGRILVILDGAPEPVQPWPTTLEAAATPALDALCAAGAVGRVTTTPHGFEPGSETGIPTLLGGLPADGQPGRGPIEAAAAGIEIPAGWNAWRLDIRHPGGRRTTDREVRLLWPLLRTHLPNHCVVPLRGHRVLALGRRRPALPRIAGLDVTVWADGAALTPCLPPATTMVCGPGAAAGIGRLLGARVVVPDGATGDVDTDLGAKAVMALAALHRGNDVIVHVGASDEAAHRLDRDAKRAAIEAIDAHVIAPLAETGATVTVTADHGTCPYTGRHDASPVPYVVAGPGIEPAGPDRLTERRVEVFA